MRQSLRTWIADADTRHTVDLFELQDLLAELTYQDGRLFDLYLSLVGELFDFLREPPQNYREWATLGNAFAQVAAQLRDAARRDACFMAAGAFYSGGYSASAYVAMRETGGHLWTSDTTRACYDLIARPRHIRSERVARLLAAVRTGEVGYVDEALAEAETAAQNALHVGPDEWIAERVYASLVRRFHQTNLRAVLPAGSSSKWDLLVTSLMDRSRPVWDFFPSQIAAIEAGLLSSSETFSMQMPTGAGKTALTEALLFSHLSERPGDLAVLLVPYRALARELRGSIGKQLAGVGLPNRTIYGGTVPTPDEAHELEQLRVIIATPEALTGLLGSAPELLNRISLVVCDEGHLLDQPGRGVGLELLLARLRGRDTSPRIVFLSAIVPNIEEINAWLGGSADSVVRSDFRPAEAQYAILRPRGKGAAAAADLELQGVETTLQAHRLRNLLHPQDFRFMNPATGRPNNYPHETVKAQAIATARKALALGTVAVFATAKRGNQGVIGLADELLRQLATGIPLPLPLDAVKDRSGIDAVSDYLSREYGEGWVGTRSLRSGAVVHHGDLPQETREAVEVLLTDGHIRMVICTSTLAEGVNLPIRTLVLYAIERRTESGVEPMLARDIRNLVGRAGRAGSSTRGLVILANPSQWQALAPVVTGQPGEDVHGYLQGLVEAIRNAVRQGTRLTNTFLEHFPILFSMTDGIDATLLELLHDELGDEEFRALAGTLAKHTFAAQQLDDEGQAILGEVFRLRANRLAELRATGRLGWVRETGSRVRLLDSVLEHLEPRLENWQDIESPLDPDLVDAFLGWSYSQADFRSDLVDAFPRRMIEPSDGLPPQASVREFVLLWMSGATFGEIAEGTGLSVDEALRVYGTLVSYAFASLVEQAVAILERYYSERGLEVAEAVLRFPEHLRYGVATPTARRLMAGGVRHRRAAVLLGGDPAMADPENLLRDPRELARELIADEVRWIETLGTFVFSRTVTDLAEAPG